MWRTVIVTQGEKLTVRDNWLVVWSDSTVQRVPIGDLYSVVIDNRAALVSVTALTTLAQANVHVYLCDDKHVPVALSLPINTHSVYSRTVRNHDDAEKHCRTIERNVPPNGAVRALVVTEKQYTSMRLLVGEKLATENLLDSSDIIEL